MDRTGLRTADQTPRMNEPAWSTLRTVIRYSSVYSSSHCGVFIYTLNARGAIIVKYAQNVEKNSGLPYILYGSCLIQFQNHLGKLYRLFLACYRAARAWQVTKQIKKKSSQTTELTLFREFGTDGCEDERRKVCPSQLVCYRLSLYSLCHNCFDKCGGIFVTESLRLCSTGVGEVQWHSRRKHAGQASYGSRIYRVHKRRGHKNCRILSAKNIRNCWKSAPF